MNSDVRTGIRNTVILCLAFIALVLVALLYNTSREFLLNRDALRAQGVSLLPVSRAISFALKDQQGNAFSQDDLKGRWSLIYFGYTQCPDVCPATLSALAGMERRIIREGDQTLLDRLDVIMVTVDPERDDATALKKYVGAFSKRFYALTGSREAIAGLAKQVNVAFSKVPGTGGSYRVDHTERLVLADPKGHYAGFIRSAHDPDELLLIVRSLVAAAA